MNFDRSAGFQAALIEEIPHPRTSACLTCPGHPSGGADSVARILAAQLMQRIVEVLQIWRRVTTWMAGASSAMTARVVPNAKLAGALPLATLGLDHRVLVLDASFIAHSAANVSSWGNEARIKLRRAIGNMATKEWRCEDFD
jgi:hypothetical protein